MGYPAMRRAMRQMPRLIGACGLATIGLWGKAVSADAIAPLAASCQTCHAGQGAIPAITALPPAVFITLMRGFRDNPEGATIMPRFATGLTDEEIAALAAWFAEQDR